MAVRNEFSAVKKVIIVQAFVAIVLSVAFLLAGGVKQAISPLSGSLIALLPSCYFAYRVYLSRKLEAKKMVRAFYRGETTKILLTAALFAMVFQIPDINLLTLLIGYVAVLSVYFFALLWRE